MVQSGSSPTRRRVLVVAPDVVGPRMAGPGMRYVAIARELATVADVTLALGTEGSEAPRVGADEALTVATIRSRDDLAGLVAEHDVVFAQFIDTNVVRESLERDPGIRFVFDLYNALPVETVGSERISGFDTLADMEREFAELLKYFRFCSRAGSYFVTSNERQRDYWLGFIMAADGVTPGNLGGRAADEIVGLVPFGSENTPPTQRAHGIRGRFGIGEDDFVLLWAGGIWDWFDAETPIRAVARLAATHPRVKLVFYGTVHPNPAIGRPRNVDRAIALAEELGVLGTSVHFLDDWVPADTRADYLLDADVAVSAHRASLETRFAFRTRILDHFWAGLPSVVTTGDWFGDYIRDHELGHVTEPGDVVGFAEAVAQLADDERERARIADNVARVSADWTWRRTTEPLKRALVDGFDALPQGRLPVEPPAPQDAVAPPPGPSIRARLSAGPIGRVFRALKRRVGRG